MNSAHLWDAAPNDHEPRVLLVQSEPVVGTMGALSAALSAVSKGDNQTKLSKAEADERHLYVFMEDGGAGAVLEGAWPLPECPPDPADVAGAVEQGLDSGCLVIHSGSWHSIREQIDDGLTSR